MHQRKLKPNKQKYKIRLIENVFWVKKGKRQKITSETPYMFVYKMSCPISKKLKIFKTCNDKLNGNSIPMTCR